MKSVKLIVEYETKTGPVTMDIKTGQGQLGVHYAKIGNRIIYKGCLLYTSPSPRDGLLSRMPSSA